jgi:hypothetical protein
MTTNAAAEFQFHKAVREQIRLLIGLSGGTGSGKTYSAMRLAKGLAGDKRFAVIDTENGRASMYADYFQFDVVELSAPFTPDRYLAAITAAEKAGYGVILVDSMSHEWAGDGGILDMQEDELDRMAGDDWKKREAVRMTSWIKPKMSHKSMVAHLLQLKAHVILCFRAEAKIEMVKENGKMVVRPKESLTGLDGWIPICEKNMPYELTASFLLTADAPGFAQPIKCQEQHKPFFTEEKTVAGVKGRYFKTITEDAGRLLGEWAKGGTPKVPVATAAPAPKPPVQETKPGVYEPKGQESDTAVAMAWFKQIEAAATLEDLKGIGMQLAKSSLLPDDLKTARELFAARQKQLKNGAAKQSAPETPQSPDLPAAGGQKGAHPSAPASTAEEPWI